MTGQEVEVPQETLAETGEEPAPQRQEGVAEKMSDQPLQPQGGVAEKANDPSLQPQGGVAEKANDPSLQPVPSPRDTTSHPQEGGGAVGAKRMVIGQEAGEEQPVYHSPSPEDKEMLQTSIEESLMSPPTTSQMAVKETSLVRREWYPENSELLLPTTK